MWFHKPVSGSDSLKTRATKSREITTAILSSLWNINHYGVMALNRFPHYWPLLWGIHRSPVIPSEKANKTELCCYIWCHPEETAEHMVVMPMIWDAITLVWRHCNGWLWRLRRWWSGYNCNCYCCFCRFCYCCFCCWRWWWLFMSLMIDFFKYWPVLILESMHLAMSSLSYSYVKCQLSAFLRLVIWIMSLFASDVMILNGIRCVRLLSQEV